MKINSQQNSEKQSGNFNCTLRHYWIMIVYDLEKFGKKKCMSVCDCLIEGGEVHTLPQKACRLAWSIVQYNCYLIDVSWL